MSTKITPASFLAIGKVLRPHGLKGWLRVKLYDPQSQALLENDQLYLQDDKLPPKKYKLLHFHELDTGVWLILLEEISRREEAEQLQNQELLLHREQIPKLPEDEVYLSDLIGYEVIQGTQKIGVVTAVPSYGGQDLLEVRRPSSSLVLIPLVSTIVTQIQKKARSILIDPPEGLLEINESSINPDSSQNLSERVSTQADHED